MSLRISHWIWIVLLLGASAMLYHTSYRVQELEKNIAQLEAQRALELENIHVLETEWASLTAPLRLQRLADKYLQLQPVLVAQIVPEQKLARRLPRRANSELMANNGQPHLALAVMHGADGR